MAGFNFDVAMLVGLFLIAVWSVGRLFARMKLPPLVGQMLVGVLLGPQGMDLVPYASNGACQAYSPAFLPAPDAALLLNSTGSGSTPCGSSSGSSTGRMLGAGSGDGSFATCMWTDWFRFDANEHLTSIWVFSGNVGVTLMIFESGMHIHFDKVASVGKSATVVAIIGTAMPIVLGFVLVGLIFSGSFPDHAYFPFGFAAGCAFAPTSVGISLSLLEEAKMLGSMAGQMTITAAFIDDVFSLVTLVILGKIAQCAVTVQDILVPIFVSFGFLALGIWLALKVFPKITDLLAKIPLKKNVPIQDRDQVHLMLMFLSLIFFGWVSSVGAIGGEPFINSRTGTGGVPFIGSHLLGAFAGGMAWVNVPRSHAIWQAQLKRIVKWMMRVFFACTVGFAVPVAEFASFKAWWRGILLGIGPCIGMKLFSGVFAYKAYKSDEDKRIAKQASWATKFLQPQQMLVGIAMVARGEFAYLVAEMAKTMDYQCPLGEPPVVKMMDSEVYAAVIIALVMATVVSPVLFRWALAVFDRATPIHRSVYIGGDRKEFQSRAFVIHLAGRYAPGVQREIFNTLHASGLDILEARLATVRADDTADADIISFVNNFTVASRGKKKDFDDEKLEEMQHTLAEVLNSHDASVIFEPYDEDYSGDGIIEVQILGEHHPELLQVVTNTLATMGLDVIKASVHHSQQPGQSHHGKPESSPTVSRNASPGLMRRGLSANNLAGSPAPAPAPAATSTTNEISIDVSEMSARPEMSAAARVKVSRLFTRGGHKGGSVTKDPGHEHGASHSHEVGREVFYARESDGSKATTAERRSEIQVALRGLLEAHGLHGEVLVRLLHESEMALAHSVPRLDSNAKKKISVVKCVGKHHKELLHEICSTFDANGCDVVHGDIDTDASGQEIDVFYIQKRDATALNDQERLTIKTAIQAQYASHKVEGKVIIEQGDSMSPPVSPASKASNPKQPRDWKLDGSLRPPNTP